MGIALWVVGLISSAATVDYQAPAACPDAPTFRALVASQLGRDPFGDEGSLHLKVRFGAKNLGFEAFITLERSGEVLGSRSLESNAACAEFAQSVALAAALALDPLLRQEKQSAAPSVSDSPSAVPIPPPSPLLELPPIPQAPPLRWDLALGAMAALGVAPTPALGGFFEVRVGRSYWSLGVEGRLRAAGQTAVAGGIVRTFGGEVVVSPGIQWKWLGAHVLLGLGGLRIDGHDLPNATGESIFTGFAGLRAEVAPPLSARWSLVAFIEGDVPFVRPTVRYGADVVWQMPPMVGLVAFGVRVKLA